MNIKGRSYMLVNSGSLRVKADILNLAQCQSQWRRADTPNVSFETLYSGQFMLSTQLITLNYPILHLPWCWLVVGQVHTSSFYGLPFSYHQYCASYAKNHGKFL